MHERFKQAVLGFVVIGAVALTSLFKLGFPLRFFLLFGALFHAWMLGKRLFPRAYGVTQALLGGSCFLALAALGQTLWFYAGFSLNALSDVWILLFAMLICHVVNVLSSSNDGVQSSQLPTQSTTTDQRIALLLIGVVTFGALSYVLNGAWHAATADAIRTVWPRLPSGTLLAIALLWITIPVSAWFVGSRVWTSVHAGCAIFATTAIAPLVYTIGFGFDGFLHLAGEQQLLATGTLSPKPLYYIGQYVLTTFLSRVADFPIESIDRWLVPVAAAILLPCTLSLVAMRARARKEERALLPFGLFLLPLAPFVATTPQSFAYVLGIGAVTLALASSENVRWPAPLLLGAWAAAAHPLAGIPLVLLTLALLCARTAAATWLRCSCRALSWSFIFGAALSLPFLFYLLSLKSGTPIQWNLASLGSWESWRSFFASFTPWIGNTYVIWPAWASLILQAIPLLALAGAIGTLSITSHEQRRTYILLVAAGILLFLAGMILKTAGTFAFLIDYERGNYAERVVLLATFCLVVAALPAVAWITERTRARPSVFSLFLLVACGSIAAAQSSNALPRHDALVTGRGWSVGFADLAAVVAIDRDAEKQPYTVLANQSVSAAAISQFGFKRYNGDIFYYPLPTGGPLYQTYLRMTNAEPSRDTAMDAAKLGGSQLVYVVLNDYWWKAEHVGRSLSAIADQEWMFGETDAGVGKSVRVYKFELNSSSNRSTQTSGS